MGCDIHMYVEKKVEGKWTKVNNIKNPYYEKEESESFYTHTPNDEHPPYWVLPYIDTPFHSRNYQLFSLLADVRNNKDAYIKPISQPRGLPKDVSPEVKDISDNWGIDGHSHSWFTLKELKDFHWEEEIASMHGIVPLSKFEDFIKKGIKFTSWSGWTSGVNIVVVSHDDGLKIINRKKGTWPKIKSIPLLKRDKKEIVLESHKIYVDAKWKLSYKEMCSDFLRILPNIEEVAKLTEKGSLEDVRIVFWFDN